MKLQPRNVAACILRRPWVILPLGLGILLSLAFYWILLSQIDVLDMHKMYQQKLTIDKSDSNTIHIPSNTFTYQVCDTIHIALVCMGKCGRQVTPMFKSILYHRQNPLHFHMIVDTKSQEVIHTLFETWDLPDIKHTCYNAESQLSKVFWIPNTHYGGVYSFVKLLSPHILPRNLTRVIVLDSDLTFLSDIAELWALFKNMTDEKLFGLVENESEWYLKPGRWPALGRGFNTGVMLLNLNNIHTRTNWSQLWHEALQENLKIFNKTELGDQDIINAIIKKFPHVLYNMSCQFNVQMSVSSLASNCYNGNHKNVKVLHWNSPSKYNVALPDADYFRSVHRTFVNLDGNLLREKLHRCWPKQPGDDSGEYSDKCSSFRAAARLKLRTQLFYTEYSHCSADSFDVTIVVQLSMDRLQFLERLARYWEGPLSAAIYLADCEVHRLESFLKEEATLNSRQNIAYHLVFKHDDATHYPVNYLRNVALAHVSTPYVFLMDADFVPMEGLYTHLRSALRAVNPYPQKKCLVVAAFESQRYNVLPPRNKQQLLSRLGGAREGGERRGRGADVAPFRAHEWPRGHRATNYSRWIHATAPYEVKWEADYEPYLVVHRSVPKYDTRFSGFGWNKVSHIVELRAKGYRAVVLPDAFVVHTTHAPSADITAFRANPHYRICLALLKQEFLEDLGRKHNVTFEEFKQEPVDLDKNKLPINRTEKKR